jgi:hypothetical protein
MKNSNLYKILHCFTAPERLRFRKLLHSPFFNQREDLILLFDFWEKNTRNPSGKMQDEVAWEALKTGKPFKKNDFHLACSRLLALAETFMSYEELNAEVHWQPIRHLRAFRRKHLSGPYLKLLKEIRMRETAQPLRDKDHLFRTYRLEMEYYEHLASGPRNREINLQAASEQFQKFTISESLRQACLMLAHQSVFKKEYDFGMLPFMLNFLEQNPSWIEEPAIGAYYHCYRAVTNPEDTHYFEKLRDIFNHYRQAFPKDEVRAIYRHLLNLSIRKLNAGEHQYLSVLFQLYQTGLEEGVLLENDLLPSSTFKNIVSIALKMEEKDWAENFIKQFIVQVDRNQREEVQGYNLGKLRFAQNRFEEAMPLLAQLHSEDPLIMLDSKVLQAKMLYETGEIGVLTDFLHNFKAFLRRQTISEMHSAYFKQILDLFGKLCAMPPGDSAKKRELITLIQELKIESDKQWFLRLATTGPKRRS